MKFKILSFWISIILMAPSITSAKPPQDILEQMEIAARINAAISICLDSSEYKAMRSEKALQFHDVSLKIDRIIEIIEKNYGDDRAYLAYKLASLEIKESPEFIGKFRRTYSRSCADQLLSDMTKSVRAVEAKVNSLVRGKK
jgi:hypothetical protein